MVANLFPQWLVPLMSNHSPLLYTRSQVEPRGTVTPIHGTQTLAYRITSSA
jgi:hypothetical protein